MKKAFKTIIAIAAAALAFTACEQTIDQPIQDENLSGKHTVSFVLSDNATKTTVAENDGVANFSWGNEDKVPANFHLYENGAAGETDDVTLDNGLMSVTATFSGNTAPYSYTGFYSFGTQDGATYPYVKAAQTMRSGKYDYESDILVAKKTEGSDTQTTPLLLQFKRVVAINKMTLSGMTLADDEYISNVVISSDKAIAGKYSWNTDDAQCAWGAQGTSITVTGCNQSDNKNVVYFVSAPVTDATLTISATTNKGNSYFKAFTKTISFTEGSYNTFSVTMAAEKVMTFTYDSHLGWTVNADDKTSYYLLNSGKTITTPVFSFDQINKIEITQRTFGGNKYNTTEVKLGGSVIASVIADGSTLKNSSTTSPLYTTATSDAQLVFEANPNCCSEANGPGISVIKIHYLGSDPILPEAYSITIDGAIENGTVEADKIEASEGELVTLTVTPDTGYELDELTVTNTTTSEDIVVADDYTFEMPASGVYVSATFAADDTPSFTIVPNNAFWNTAYDGTISDVASNPIDLTGTSNGLSINMKNGTSTNGYINDSQTRVYEGYKLTFKAPSGYNITDIKFTADGTNWKGTHTASTGAMTDNKNWTGSSSSVTISFGGTCRIVSIDVTLAVCGPTVSVESISLDRTSLTMVSGQNETLVATILPADASNKDVTWTSSDESVAVVSNGTVTAISTGTTIITAKTVDGEYTATCNVTVSVPIYTSLAELVAAGAPTGGKVTVTLTDEVIVDFYTSGAYTNGVYLMVGDKKIEIYCKNVPSDWKLYGTISGTLEECDWKEYGGTWELCPENWDDLDYDEPTATAVTGVSLDKEEATVEAGKTTTLVATVAPVNATNKNVTWSSDDEDVATVVDGVVTGVAEGTATITVTTEDGDFTADCVVTVTAASVIAGTYTKITSLAELTTGDYVIVGAQKAAEMGELVYGTLNSGRIPYVDEYTSAPASIVKTNADGASVWHVTVSGTLVTLYNADNGKYIADAGSGKLKYDTIGMSFTAACADGVFSLASGTYFLCINSSADYWRNYASSTGYNQGVCLYFYKKGTN